MGYTCQMWCSKMLYLTMLTLMAPDMIQKLLTWLKILKKFIPDNGNCSWQNNLTTTSISSWCGSYDHITSYSSADRNLHFTDLGWGLTFHQISVESIFVISYKETNTNKQKGLIYRSDLNHVRLKEKKKTAELMYSKRVFLEAICFNLATNHMATVDGEEKEVQQIIIISEHDAQIMGLLIDCADSTITETSNYHDMDPVMINDEWDRLPCSPSDFSLPQLLASHLLFFSINLSHLNMFDFSCEIH